MPDTLQYRMMITASGYFVKREADGASCFFSTRCGAEVACDYLNRTAGAEDSQFVWKDKYGERIWPSSTGAPPVKTFTLPEIVDILNGLERFDWTYDGPERGKFGDLVLTEDLAKAFGIVVDSLDEQEKRRCGFAIEHGS